MIRIISLIFAFAMLIFASQAQRKKKNSAIPRATSATDRWQGYQQRLALEANSLVKNVEFRNVGPTVMSGRVVDLAVDPTDPTHFYVAYASGSLWETKNNGTSFTPIFDNQIVMTIGDVASDWTNGIIYVGTGENNSSRSSYSGYGVFKSEDNGQTWQHLGLAETHHIGRIILHPNDSKTIWVAALGHLYSENPERGIYKSTDGGKTWRQTLFINNRTGVVDLVISPDDPNLLIASAWERDRKAWNFVEAGHSTGIYRSEDGGELWHQINMDSGFPNTEGTGRIGLSFAPSDAAIVYAILDNQDRREKEDTKEKKSTKDRLKSMPIDTFLTLENQVINQFLDDNDFPKEYNAVDIKEEIKKGKIKPIDLVTYTEDANSLLFDTPVKGAEMYRSDDYGVTWKKTHEKYIESMIFSYGYYFGQVRVDTQNPEIVYTMGVPIVRSEDGGKTWSSINEDNVHVDHHAMWINPDNPTHLILGNDGGVYISYDTGNSWINCNSPSVGQFYSVTVDMDTPYHVYGGLQDNGVWKGPSTYAYSRKWYQEGQYPYKRLMGGDGMQVAVDTRDNNVVYTGYQFGNYFKVNAFTGTRTYITPKHKLGESPFRWNWEAPIALSSYNQDIIYFGSNKFHRSMNQGNDFETLSEDLTNGGRKGDVSYGTLTTISESPLRFGLIYVGSDDGLIHVSKDGGESWNRISAALPQHFWVSQVYASHHEEGRVYVSLNGYRWDCFEPMVYVSNDYGQTWKAISSDLPKEPVNVIKEDPENKNVLYVGTDHGAYVSLDQGQTYHAFVRGLSNAPVHDMVIHPREKDLIVGTHGRSIYIGDLSLIQALNEDILVKPLYIFPMETALYNPKWGSKAWEWGEAIEPKINVSFYSGTKGKATILCIYKEQRMMAKEVEADRGLNIFEMDLKTTRESFDELINENQVETYKVGENGNYYLIPNEYIVQVKLSDETVETPLIIEKPKDDNKRKEK